MLLKYISKECFKYSFKYSFAPHASGPSPSSVGTPGSGNTIKPLSACQYYITGGSVAVAA